MPGDRMRMRCCGPRSRQECSGQQLLPPDSVSHPPQQGIGRVIDLFAGQAPERRFPKYRVLSPQDEMLPKQSVDTQCARYGNQYPRVSPEVVAPDREFFIPDKRKVDAKPGDHEEYDDRWSGK